MKKPTSGAKQENRSFTAYLDETKISIIIKFLPSTLFPVSFRNNARCSFFALVPLALVLPEGPIGPGRPFFPCAPAGPCSPLAPSLPLRPGTPGTPGNPMQVWLNGCFVF